jgi:hypothetical protein
MVRGFPSHFGHWRICGAAALASFSSSEIIIVTFAEGSKVRDFYSGNVATVSGGKITLQPAFGSNGGVVPVERRRRGRLGAFKQQQAIAAEGGLQSDFASAARLRQQWPAAA